MSCGKEGGAQAPSSLPPSVTTQRDHSGLSGTHPQSQHRPLPHPPRPVLSPHFWRAPLPGQKAQRTAVPRSLSPRAAVTPHFIIMDAGLCWELALLHLHGCHCPEAKLHSNRSEPSQDESQGCLDTLPCPNPGGPGCDWRPKDSRASAAQGAGTRRLTLLAADGGRWLCWGHPDRSPPISRGSVGEGRSSGSL